jgi:lycopene cyclase domain-containing protein
MNGEYLILLGVIVIFPLIFSFDRNLRLYEHRWALVIAVGGMCLPFWIWDVAATWRGHWSFSPQYTLGVGFLGMPVEEWLFFPVVGFVSIFTWESVKYFRSRWGGQ